MRKTIVAAVIVAASSFGVLVGGQGQSDAKATAVMSEVRKALGGEQKLSSVKTLSMRADYRREASAGGPGMRTMVMVGGPGGSMGEGSQVSGKIEIDLELPDKFLRSDIGSAGFAMTRTDGFEGDRPFVEIVPNAPGMRVQVDNPTSDPARAKVALKRSRDDLARLMLGLVGGTYASFPVTYAYGGQAESPDGKADIIDVTGPDNFKARLFVDVETHLPLMITFMEAEPRTIMRTFTREGGQRGAPPTTATATAPTRAPGSASTGPLTPEERDQIEKEMRDAEAAPPKMIEYRLFFSDYRKVDGVLLPHRVARGTGGKTNEEWEVTSYKVNPSFKADRFKVGR